MLILLLLGGATYVWHNVIAKESGKYARRFIEKAAAVYVPVQPNSVVAVEDATNIVSNAIDSDKGEGDTTSVIIDGDEGKEMKSSEPTKLGRMFVMEYKEPVVQVAFGKTLKYMNVAQKFEFGLSWAIVLLIVGGYVVAVVKRKFSGRHMALALLCFMFIGLTLLIPSMSNGYGIARVYFTSLPLLAPCFVIGVIAVGKRIKTNPYLLATVLLVSYSLCVSGVLYTVLGVAK